jgi:hypothetical protein
MNYHLKKIGEILLNICQKNKIYESKKNNMIFYVNFDIKNYITNIYFDKNLYKIFSKLNLITDIILGYNLKLKLYNSKIQNIQININYEIFKLIIKYAILPNKLFNITGIVKLEVYFNCGMKIDEQTIYNFNNNLTNYIFEYLYKINNEIVNKNYNIEIYENYILFTEII